jgi:hypothetical protein
MLIGMTTLMQIMLSMFVYMAAMQFITLSRNYLSGEAKVMVSFCCLVASVLRNGNKTDARSNVQFLTMFCESTLGALVPVFILLYIEHIVHQ